MNMFCSLAFLFMCLSTFIPSIFLQGCLNSTSREELVSENIPPTDLNRQILEILSLTKPCESLSECDTEEVTLIPKTHMKGTAEQILVIDQNIRLAAYTRYKSRVLDHLIANDDGKFVSDPQMFKVPKPVFEVLSNILDEKNPLTPAVQLNDVADEFAKHLRCVDSNTGHGAEIFGTLADLNPEAEFVVADLMDSFRNGFCQIHSDEDARDQYKVQLRMASRSLSEQIRKYYIDYVNMSFGHDSDSFEDRWSHFCGGEKPKSFVEHQKIFFTEFYKPLLANKRVVFVQADP